MPRGVLCVLIALAACFTLAARVSAHPLGNFTINHLTVVQPSSKSLRVRYVIDMAEIPTFQLMRSSSSDARWNQAQLQRWADAEASVVANGLSILVDGARVPLQAQRDNARLRPGAGGLPTLYWTGDFLVSVPSSSSHRVAVSDTVFDSNRIGWKDIIVTPQTESTHQLLVYPSALIGSPRNVLSSTFTLRGDGRASDIAQASAPVGASGGTSIVRSNALSDMFANPNRAPLFLLLTALVAFGLGALHAIEPGHGKALLAFTLVGSRATAKQAAILAASLTFAHTIGVLILGIVLFFFADFASESIYTWITLLSGIAVAVIGARNLGRYMHARGFGHVHAHGHAHAHEQNATDHHHGDDAHAHSHAIPGTAPIDFRAAVVAAMSGGVAPCPAAIVVMLAALRLHQLGYGLVLIVIFSLGLASVLTAIGLAVVHGSAWIQGSGRFDRLVASGPLISAVLISIIGSIMVAQGFVAEGVRAPVAVIAAITALAIAGYAFTPQHRHVHPAGES